MSDRYFIKFSPDGSVDWIFDVGSSHTLKTLQDAVGGPIQVVGTTLGLAVKMVINEEGKLDGLPLNKPATELAVIRSYDYVAGDAVLCVERGEELVGFLEKDAEAVAQVIAGIKKKYIDE